MHHAASYASKHTVWLDFSLSITCMAYQFILYLVLLNFLDSSNPKKRYELFLKATQLDVIIEKLDGCLKQVDVAKNKFKSQQRQHVNYLEMQKKAHEKLNQFKSMEPLKVSRRRQQLFHYDLHLLNCWHFTSASRKETFIFHIEICLQKETKRYKCERAWLSVVNEEEFIENVNTEFENTRQKKEKTEQDLAKLNVNDGDMNEQNAQLNEEIENLQQAIILEQRKLEAEKTSFRRALDQVNNNERTVKKLEAKMAKVQETINTLEESIQSELNS